MPELRFLLYIYSGVLFTLFVGILIVWSVVVYSSPDIPPFTLFLDRVSIYTIIVLIIVSCLVIFQPKETV